jgi:hypothetical protein
VNQNLSRNWNHPMGMVAPLQRIASAFFVFLGRRGDVSRQAQQRGVSRQALYRESRQVVVAVTGEEQQAEIARGRQRIEELERLRAEARKRAPLTVTIAADKQAEFASVGQAQGVSLPVLQRLLQGLLGEAAPSVATLGRFTQAAGRRATALLAVLDEVSRPLVKQGLADEIFVGSKPVLMVVEPDSLCWMNGRLAPSREGDEWANDLRPLSALEQVTCDRGSGLLNGVKQINAERRANGQTALADQSDHFHLCYEATKALRKQRNASARALKKAEEATKKVTQVRRQGRNLSGYARSEQRWWRVAEQAMDHWSAAEQAWQRLRQGMGLFTPTGELNSRAKLEALIAEIQPQLIGSCWAKVKRMLASSAVSTFLDRTHEQLADLPIEAEVRQAVVEAEGIRRRPELLEEPSTRAAALRGTLLVTGVLLSLFGSAGQQAVEAVRNVLRHTWRASSLVEGVNSVLRMQQARHRRLTQEMLDLKRLYWNCRTLRTGKRRKQSPYQRLGLILPNRRWWELLKLSPEQLRAELSAVKIAA